MLAGFVLLPFGLGVLLGGYRFVSRGMKVMSAVITGGVAAETIALGVWFTVPPSDPDRVVYAVGNATIVAAIAIAFAYILIVFGITIGRWRERRQSRSTPVRNGGHARELGGT